MAEHKDAWETFRESEAKLRGIVEAGFDIVALVDQSGCITYVSPQVEALSGYRTEELAGQPFAAFLPEAEKTRVAELFAMILRGEHLTGLEVTLTRKDGTPGHPGS